MTASEIEALIRRGYSAFNDRDIDGALAAMAPDVEWANGWEGGHVHGHEAVRAYWTRQWAELDPHVEPVEVVVAGDTAEVRVDQVVRRPDGTELRAGRVRHRYQIRNGLIGRMDIADDQ
jgi:hypothetical protein